MHPLKLTAPQLTEIAADFEKRVGEGLAAWNRQIRCMPTYISLQQEQRDGCAAVLDLGGSNLRAGIACHSNGEWRLVDRSETISMPWQRNLPFSCETLLDMQVDALARLRWQDELPLGYCFSYPAEPTPDRDVLLLKWAKGIEVPGTEGRRMGGLLLSHLARRHPHLKCSGVTVINDTVAALVGGMADPNRVDTIGLIVGTGTNMAASLSPSCIPKLAAAAGEYSLLPINLESGNYTPLHLTEWDAAVDRQSNNPGEQLLEKAVAGAYLGQIFKTVLPQAEFDEQRGGAGLSEILARPAEFPAEWIETASLVYFRSADLVAAVLVGLINMLHRLNGRLSFRIAAEGALFWGKLGLRTPYRDRVALTLETLLSMLNLEHLQVEFFKKTDTNLIGSARAALSG